MDFLTKKHKYGQISVRIFHKIDLAQFVIHFKIFFIELDVELNVNLSLLFTC